MGKQRAISPLEMTLCKMADLQTVSSLPRSVNHGSSAFFEKSVRDFPLRRRFTPAENEIYCFAEPIAFSCDLKNPFELRCFAL
jgi:hypothetical protein